MSSNMTKKEGCRRVQTREFLYPGVHMSETSVRTERIYPFGTDRCRKDKVNTRIWEFPLRILRQPVNVVQ